MSGANMTRDGAASCCYDHAWYVNNEVVANFPISCMQLVCVMGNIEFVSPADECDRNCCTLNGQLYPDGSTEYVNCYLNICDSGTWNTDTSQVDPTCCPLHGQQYSDGSTLYKDCYNNTCDSGTWNIDTSDVDPTCCPLYGQQYSDGSTLYIDCYNNTCDSGTWNIDTSDVDPTCCLYNDRIFEDGDQLPTDCAVIYCNNSFWSPSDLISAECSLCQVYDDPHFRTYGNYSFDYHLRCNYSLTQIGNLTEPESGIFVQFEQCWLAACLETATIREDENTIIRIGTKGGLKEPNIYEIDINGCLYIVNGTTTADWITCDGITYGVLVWRFGNGIRVMGTHFFVQHLEHSLSVWVLPSPQVDLQGFCGAAVGQPDMFIGRDGTEYNHTFAAPDVWGESWTAGKQKNGFCVPATTTRRRRQTGMNAFCPPETLTTHTNTCYHQLSQLDGAMTIPTDEFDSRKDACALDLCFITSPEDQASWLGEVSSMFEELVDIINNTVYVYQDCKFYGERFSHGDLQNIDCWLKECVDGDWMITDVTDPSCCWFDEDLYPEGSKEYINCSLNACDNGTWVPDPNKVDPTCCMLYGNLHLNGSTEYVNCYLDTCENGNWNTITSEVDPTCCWYNGTHFDDGDILPDVCAVVYCNSSIWSPSVLLSAECSLCEVYDLLHYNNYRDHSFDYHSSCNYSVSQTGTSVVPERGVFVEFEQCWVSSCLDTTTIREDENTIIQIGTNGGFGTPDIYTIDINGCSYTVPGTTTTNWISCDGITYGVLAWRHDKCIRVLGTHFLVQQCKHSLNIWVLPSAEDLLYGLCGPADDVQPDKFIARDLTEYNITSVAPYEWAGSWTAAEQGHSFCVSSVGVKVLPKVQLACPADAKTTYNNTCFQLLSNIPNITSVPLDDFVNYQASCVADLCMIDPVDQNMWLNELVNRVEEMMDIIKNTVPSADVRKR